MGLMLMPIIFLLLKSASFSEMRRLNDEIKRSSKPLTGKYPEVHTKGGKVVGYVPLDDQHASTSKQVSDASSDDDTSSFMYTDCVDATFPRFRAPYKNSSTMTRPPPKEGDTKVCDEGILVVLEGIHKSTKSIRRYVGQNMPSMSLPLKITEELDNVVKSVGSIKANSNRGLYEGRVHKIVLKHLQETHEQIISIERNLVITERAYLKNRGESTSEEVNEVYGRLEYIRECTWNSIRGLREELRRSGFREITGFIIAGVTSFIECVRRILSRRYDSSVEGTVV
jgi:hypothetical protein